MHGSAVSNLIEYGSGTFKYSLETHTSFTIQNISVKINGEVKITINDIKASTDVSISLLFTFAITYCFPHFFSIFRAYVYECMMKAV